VIGGALAGASTALLLRRKCPNLRIALIERAAAFDRKVGEATVEVSAYFLNRILELGEHLQEQHLPKQGLRFWFSNSETKTIEDCAEMGGRYLPRVPAWQLDRAVLDEEVLSRAVSGGATLIRPARVTGVELNEGALQKVSYTDSTGSHEVTCRWVIDASGLAALLARANGWLIPNQEHPTTAVWARWRNVKSWDSSSLLQRFPNYRAACHGLRHTATNHVVGPGWWSWFIPLKGGDVSVGVVFDQRLVTFPSGDNIGSRLKQFLSGHPAAAEILKDAEVIEGDVHWRKNLPYHSSRICGDGFFLVGDAAAFLDPFYSPGMDWIAYTASCAADSIARQQAGEPIRDLMVQRDHTFVRSYRRWFQALYKDKYYYMADFDLYKVTFFMDTGLYYLGVASQPFKRGEVAYLEPTFSTPPSVPFYHFMSFYNRRLAKMGRSRLQRGVFGKNNARQRLLFAGYTFAPSDGRHVFYGMLLWLLLELKEGWRSWFSVGEDIPVATPIPVQQSLPQ
jgi:flavin-dependent dehydrogenase